MGKGKLGMRIKLIGVIVNGYELDGQERQKGKNITKL